MAQEDVTRGVLIDRLAEFFSQNIRGLHGKPRLSLLQVPPNEAAEMRQWAACAMRLVDEIEAERPPTAFEVTRYEQRKALVLAHGRVRVQAWANHHKLSVWRPDPDRDGRELAACELCGAGASIHLETGQESLSDQLLRVCPRATFPHRQEPTR